MSTSCCTCRSVSGELRQNSIMHAEDPADSDCTLPLTVTITHGIASRGSSFASLNNRASHSVCMHAASYSRVIGTWLDCIRLRPLHSLPLELLILAYVLFGYHGILQGSLHITPDPTLDCLETCGPESNTTLRA